ncbi:hypothetical protein [Pararhizobium gei]|uniref:hypothetical protein n=1 Tax=Pararhizobium gei TaxID=1395951 RepID=UPI0023DB7747|nr:hypothetical protein [Rhizobium gei]
MRWNGTQFADKVRLCRFAAAAAKLGGRAIGREEYPAFVAAAFDATFTSFGNVACRTAKAPAVQFSNIAAAKTGAAGLACQ